MYEIIFFIYSFRVASDKGHVEPVSGTYVLKSSKNKDIVGLLELPYMYSPSLGISKDIESIGLRVINKAIDSITDEEIQSIYDKWIFTERIKTYDSFNEWYSKFGVVFGGVVVILILLYLRRRLS